MSFFSSLFHRDSQADQEHTEADLVLYAPVSGPIVPLKEVPDLVISEKIVGDGVAFIPETTEVLAPCEGVISRLLASNNAFAIRSPSGIEIYVTFGIGSSRFSGVGFSANFKIGDTVKRGDSILRVDLPKVTETLQSTVTSMIVIESSADIKRVTSRRGSAVANETQCTWVTLNHEEKKD